MAIILALLCLIMTWYFSSLPQNYRVACSTRLPIIVSPINPANPFWLVFSSMFEPALSRFLPKYLYNRIKVTIFGWEYRCRYAVHEKLGPVFVLVTPASNEVWIADADMAANVLLRRNDFLQMELASRTCSLFALLNCAYDPRSLCKPPPSGLMIRVLQVVGQILRNVATVDVCRE